MKSQAIPFSAKLLGYFGVLPFAVLAVVHYYGAVEVEAWAVQGFLAYGAVILSFLGGIRWGVASVDDRFRGAAPFIAVLPSLWAFACLLWPDPGHAVWALLAGFLMMGVADRWFPAPGSADWMVVLRVRLSSAVIACHGILIASMTVQ
jgi:hypothetical protein